MSSTYFVNVENTGGAGTAVVTVSYQGYTETQQVPIEAKTRYVLGSKFPMTSSGQNMRAKPCVLSVQLPGLTLNTDMGAKPTSPDYIDLI